MGRLNCSDFAHQLVSESLASVEIGPEIVADLYKPVALRFDSEQLVFKIVHFLKQFINPLCLRNHSLLKLCVAPSISLLQLLSPDSVNCRVHLFPELLDNSLEAFVLLLKGLSSGSIYHLCKVSLAPLEHGSRPHCVSLLALLHCCIVPLHELSFQLVKTVI